MEIYYKKYGIEFKKLSGFKYDLEKLLDHHKLLVKGNKVKGMDLDKTIPLWPKNTEDTTKKA